jgi:hypothetical protein
MVQPGGGFDLAKKPLRAQAGGELGLQNLDRDLAMVFPVLREVDDRHPAAAEFALDRIAVG